MKISLEQDDIFEKLEIQQCVDRIDWIVTCCRDKAVLDIGCLDETAFASKHQQGGQRWLHGRIKEVATRIVGIDPSGKLQQFKDKFPAEMEAIQYGFLKDASEICRKAKFQPEVIVAGELIEHLQSPADLFKDLSELIAECPAELIITTPNAFAYQSFLMAILKRESQHVDHVAIFSPKTLSRLAQRCGCEITKFVTAYTEYNEFFNRASAFKYVLLVLDRILFRPAQSLFPAIGGTLMCRVVRSK